MMGTTRDALMCAVLDKAVEFFRSQMSISPLEGREHKPGRGDAHLVKVDRRKRGHSDS